MLRLLLLLLTLFVGGCASLEAGESRIIDSWRGSHLDQVMRHWGIPDRQAQLSDGTTLYQWGHSQTYFLPGSTAGKATVIGNTAYISTQTTSARAISGECTRYLIAHSDGGIVDGGARGNNCCIMAIAGHCASLLNPSR